MFKNKRAAKDSEKGRELQILAIKIRSMFILNLLQNGHDWEKVNQVGKKNRRGIYDEFRCKHCGLRGKSYTLGLLEIAERDRKKAAMCKGARKCAKSYVKVIRCDACGKAFANLTPGSIHKVVPSPNGKDNSRGEWVMGVGEPVLLLFGEFSYTDEIAEGKKIEG
ncbi:hypothetical protein [Prevotellamassilia timonensis]|uniref:hypothetical protein n=1 Tax=Prevotellamassilia timonensis TaxID=1852370 RepID=UPI0008DA88E7|nr:hypothetical protein [Prevotellamassilia timonensis]